MSGAAVTIDAIELRRYRLPLDPPFLASWDPQPRAAFDVAVVIVRAGEVEGVGAGDAMAGFAGYEHLFIGEDLFALERHAAVLDNLQFHAGRPWPLDVALWDAAAKLREQPLWRFLGGTSSHVRVYASTGARLPAHERAETARRIADAGFPAMKLRFHAEDRRDDLAVVRAVRDAVGDRIELLVDANQGWRMPWDTSPPWTLAKAQEVARQLQAHGVYWLEEPLHRHAYQDLRVLRESCGVRIAGGEGAREYGELREYVHHRSLDVLQPDVAWSTGVSGGLRIAREAHAAGIAYTPHTWGDGIVLLANLHVAAAAGASPFVEYPYDPPGWTPSRRDFLLRAPVLAEGGYVDLGDEPGLGAAVDWDGVARWRIA